MNAPNAMVPVALAAFVLFVVGCFVQLHPRRAVLVSMFAGWLFLPTFDNAFRLPLLHAKVMFVPAVVFFASVVFDGDRWLRFRPRLVDLPIAVVCLSPFISSLVNGLGPYDGGSAVFETSIIWAAPYLLGRTYFSEARTLREFAVAIVAATLVYVPFCLWEVRMSPQLHATVYGFQPFESFVQSIRFGSYRPSVFMNHGLMLGMFMTAGTLIAFWMWRTGASRDLWGTPIGWLCALLAATALLCKSTGALALLMLGLAVLEGARRIRSSAPLLILLALPPAYCVARTAGWTGRPLVSLARQLVNEERAQSVEFRIENEDLLIAKASERPGFGWARWGRSRVYDESGRDISIIDGLWILTLGTSGLVGLISLGIVLALPSLLLMRSFPGRHWGDPRLAPATALAVVGALGGIDDVFNAMLTPMFPAIAGSLTGLYLTVMAARRRKTLVGASLPSAVSLSGATAHLRQWRPRRRASW
jgi:hypothetical protein